MGAVQINMSDGFAEIKYEDNGMTKNKLIDIDDLHAVFKDNVDYDSGDLGVWGDGAMGIKRLISRGNKHWVLVDAVNPCLTTNFGRSTIKDMYYPSLLMGVHLVADGTKYRANKQKTFIFAHENMLLSDKDQLYFFPFGNAWSNGMGRICWGSVQLPALDNFSQALGVMQMFLQGTMNSDLWENGRLVGRGDWKDKLSGSPTDKMKALTQAKGCERFPYENVTMKKKIKYNDLIKYCKDNL